jgi:hypothetical protein
VGFATEMPGGWTGGGSQVPLDDSELLICALDHKPMHRILTDDPANLALKFLQTRHAFSLSDASATDNIAAKASFQWAEIVTRWFDLA